MKKLRWVLIAILAAVMMSVALVACAPASSLKAPEDFKLRDGVLSWAKVDGADGYEVSVDGTAYTSVEEEEADLLELVTSTATTKIYVRALANGKAGKASEYDIVVVQLAAPEKPVVSEDPETHATRISWTAGENVNKYLVTITTNGTAGREITYSRNFFEPSSTGTYSLTVKARGYSSGNTLYLTSAASPASDTLDYLEGPTLGVESINTIYWESATEFDSYNLYVDGKKIRENVEMPAAGSPLNLVTGSDPVLTKTGEYTLQLEAVKDGKSYWSNPLLKYGTSNINPNEIYSFDNRKVNFTFPKTGVEISNERKYGDSGYSLKVDTTSIQSQLNFIKYASDGINDIDFRNVSQISYWLYIEPCETWTESTMPYHVAPKVKYDTGNKTFAPTTIDGQPVGDPEQNPEATDTVKVGEWTKIVINCVNEYDNVFILTFDNAWYGIWPDEVARHLTMYIDDIQYTQMAEPVAEPDEEYAYKLSYDKLGQASGSWLGSEFTEIDFGTENANKKVVLEMAISGNLKGEVSQPVGIFSAMNPQDLTNDFYWHPLLKEDINSVNSWTDIALNLKLNSEGKIYLTGFNQDPDSGVSFDIFIKDEPTISKDPAIDLTVIGTLYFAPIPLKTDLPEGTLVDVSIDLWVSSSSQYAGFGYASELWADNAISNGERLLSAEGASGIQTDGWVTKTFQTKVVSFDTIVFRQADKSDSFDLSDQGNYVLLYFENGNNSDVVRYKNVNIKEGSESMTMDQIGPFFFSVYPIETDLPVGTIVDVSLEISANSTSEYSSLGYADQFWADNTPNGTELISNDQITGEGFAPYTFRTSVIDKNEIVILQSPGNSKTYTMSGNYICLYFMNGNAGDYVKIKNVQITKVADIGKPLEQIGTLYFGLLALPTELAAGTDVTVTLKIDAATTSDYAHIGYATEQWANFVPSNDMALIASKAGGWSTDGFTEYTFETKVVDFESVAFQQATATKAYEMSGNYVLMYFQNGNATDHAWVKDISITQKTAS